MKANFEKGTKVCSKCKKELPIEMFTKNKATKEKIRLVELKEIAEEKAIL